MTKRDDTSRREFIGLALSTAALSSLSPRELFAKGGAAGPGPQATAQREIPPLVDTPGWKDQGVENLTKSRCSRPIVRNFARPLKNSLVMLCPPKSPAVI